MKEAFYSHGKLLLSGEYLVLDGATALALPTRPGQWLRVTMGQADGLTWVSKNPDGSKWFETHFEAQEIQGMYPEDPFPSDTRGRLLHILFEAIRINPGFRDKLQGVQVETHLEFPRQWGLGSSSTLISNLGLWAEVDPYALLEATMGGSGYDIASARSESPLYYTLSPGGAPKISPAPFFPPFADHLFFVYLNQKQDSREGILRYREKGSPDPKVLQSLSDISRAMPDAGDLNTFRKLLDAHEILIGEILGMEPVKKKWFSDYAGSVKSLGAWGGDFVLVTGQYEDMEYFREKGYTTIQPYRDLIL